MPARPRTRRILGALLLLIFSLGVAIAGMLTASRDPLLGSWTLSGRSHALPMAYRLELLPDGTYRAAADTNPLSNPNETGTWKPCPGPLYVRTPKSALDRIIAHEYRLPTRYFTEDQLTVEHFQRALRAQSIRLAPENGHARLYRCERTSTRPGQISHVHYLTLADGELTSHRPQEGALYERPGNWLTRAWKRLREALHA